MKIILTSVLVDDQAKALDFYTGKLGFVQKQDIPVDGEARFLTVGSPEGGDVELLLEPDWNDQIQLDGKPAAQAFKQTLFEAGLPAATFGVDDVSKEDERLRGLGVRFTGEPTTQGPVTTAVLDDTCGNLIMLAAQ